MEITRIAKNGVHEKTRFCVPGQAKPRTDLRKKSSPRKQEANRNHAVVSLARVLNNNFDSNGYLLTLTYDDDRLYDLHQSLPEGEDRHALVLAALDKDARNVIRRLRRAGATDLKYVFVSSNLDGDTKNDERPHIHMVVQSMALGNTDNKLFVRTKDLTAIWGKAKIVAFKHLYGCDYTDIASYLLAQTRELPNRRSYVCSQKLERIIPDERITDERPAQPFELPAGATILDQQQGGSEGEPVMWRYIRYLLPSTSLEEENLYPSDRPPQTRPK